MLPTIKSAQRWYQELLNAINIIRQIKKNTDELDDSVEESESLNQTVSTVDSHLNNFQFTFVAPELQLRLITKTKKSISGFC